MLSQMQRETTRVDEANARTQATKAAHSDCLAMLDSVQEVAPCGPANPQIVLHLQRQLREGQRELQAVQGRHEEQMDALRHEHEARERQLIELHEGEQRRNAALEGEVPWTRSLTPRCQL